MRSFLRSIFVMPNASFAFGLLFYFWASGALEFQTGPRESNSTRNGRDVDATDIHGDSLPKGAIARLGTLRFRVPYSRGIHSLAFSATGKMLASGEGKGGVDLWEVPSGKLIRYWRPHEGIVRVEFSPNGKYLASADSKLVYVWEANTGIEVRHFEVEGPLLASLAFSPDSLSLAFLATDGSARVCELNTGQELFRSETRELAAGALAFSADGQRLAFVGRKNNTFVYSLKTKKQICAFKGGVGLVLCTAFSPDGKILATGDRGLVPSRAPGEEITIRLWDTDTGALLHSLKGHQVYWLRFIQGGKTLLSASGDGTVHWWDVAKGREVRKLQHLPGNAPCASLGPDENTLALSEGNSIELWNLAKGEPDKPLMGHQSPALFASFSPDCKTITSTSADKSCRTWDALSGMQMKSFTVDDPYFSPLALSPDCQTLAWRSWPDANVRFWASATGKHRGSLEIQAGNRPNHAAFSFDGKMLAVGHEDCAISVWDLAMKKELVQIDTFALDLIRRKQLPRASRERTWNRLSFLEFSSDGRFLAIADYSDVLVILDVISGKVVQRFTSPYITPVSFSPDWKTVACGCSAIVMKELLTGEERARIEEQNTNFSCTQFSPSGEIMAIVSFNSRGSSSESSILLCDSFSSIALQRIPFVQGTITSLFFSPDGKMLGSIGSDTTILVWDVSRIKARYASGDVPSDWRELEGPRADKAWQAMGRLISGGKSTVKFMKDRLHPAEMPKGQNIDQLIKELDDENYSVREQASSELEKMEGLARPQLEKALASKPSAELKRRGEALLAKISGPATSPEKLQILRAIEVLEHIGSSEAQEVLKTLARGAPEARVTREAKASLDRLATRPKEKP
jgi:WD40 repeat protein